MYLHLISLSAKFQKYLACSPPFQSGAFIRHSAHDRAVAKHTQHAYGTMSMPPITEMRDITATQAQTTTANAPQAKKGAKPAGYNQNITGQAALSPSCTHQQARDMLYARTGRFDLFFHTNHTATLMNTYSRVHTGANSHPGGAQTGFAKAA